MKKYSQLFLGLLLCFVGQSCSDNLSDDALNGAGVLNLAVKIQEEISVASRAISSEEQQALEEGCQINIYSQQGLIRRYKGLSNLPDTLHLLAGNYSIAVVAGDSLPASFGAKYYKGAKDFSITKGSYQRESVTCKIENVVTSVTLSDELLQLIDDDFSVKLYTAVGNDTLTFTKENIDAIGYFMLAPGITQLGWSFTAKTRLSNELYMQDGIIQGVEKATHYALTFKTTDGEVNDGATWLELTVDRTSIDIENEVDVYQAPLIWGDGFDIKSTLQYGAVSNEPITVFIATSSAIELATVTCTHFPLWGIASSTVDLATYPADAYLSTSLTYAPTSGTNYLTVTLEPALIEQLSAQDGNYTLTFYAKGVEDRLTARATLQVVVSSLFFATNPIRIEDVYTGRATITGTLLAELTTVPHFRYRIKGEEVWSTIEGTLTDQLLTAQLTGLVSGTTYEYQLYLNEESAAAIQEFTTEAKLQLPNSGFEEYHQGTSTVANKSCYLFYAEGQSLWWDSGNHGSITMNKNVTTPDTSVYNEAGTGTTSLKLQSQFVGVFGIGKFAAGNLFAGKYLKTDGTDGILGFGRPWGSRPKLLVGYLRYESGIVDYSSAYLESGVQDIGTVYMALGDWTAVEEQGEMWPVVIKTKSSERQLFDSDPETNSGLIAYGEVNYDYSTDGIIRFEIPLEYYRNRKPTSIVLVASASKYGDYFSGSTASTMWIDDLELIYE